MFPQESINAGDINKVQGGALALNLYFVRYTCDRRADDTPRFCGVFVARFARAHVGLNFRNARVMNFPSDRALARVSAQSRRRPLGVAVNRFRAIARS